LIGNNRRVVNWAVRDLYAFNAEGLESVLGAHDRLKLMTIDINWVKSRCSMAANASGIRPGINASSASNTAAS
jgi:hypothetical protein